VTENGVQLAVIGGGKCDERLGQLARETGAAIAQAGAVLLCGGRGGVMTAAAAGARSVGGRTIGILPGANSAETPPNKYIQMPIFTGLGQARNQVLVLSAAAVIGIGGGWGTLTEIGLALKHGLPVVLLNSWDLSRPDGQEEPLLHHADTAQEAVRLALDAARCRGSK